jgi:hypothetical protein
VDIVEGLVQVNWDAVASARLLRSVLSFTSITPERSSRVARHRRTPVRLLVARLGVNIGINDRI